MSNAALFIDLPNFYSRLLKSGIESPRFLRDYFLDWLDFDLLASSLTTTYSGIWIFYSGERVGPSSERLDGRILQDYIRRINALQGVTARDVNIPGEQREPVLYKCENCAHEGKSEVVSEKGIDSSLTVHLFDTADSWDTAFLLSGDADFVPAVASLRRRGKIVVGVGFSDASAALVQECYHYVNLQDVFLKEDVLAYTLFKRDGIVQKWLNNEVKHDTRFGAPETIELFTRLVTQGSGFSSSLVSSSVDRFIHFGFRGSIDLTIRRQMMTELKKKYSERIRIGKDQNNNVTGYTVSNVTALGFEAISRRARGNLTSVPGLSIPQEDEYWVTYNLNQNTGTYEPINELTPPIN